MDDVLPRFEAAARRWVAMLNGFGRPREVAAAATDDVWVDRFGFGPNRGRLVERIRGAEHLRRWADMSPREARFELAGAVEVAPSAEGPAGHVRYRVTVPMFENFGWWTFRLADDGRIAWLSHAPDEVDDAHPEGQHGAPWRDLLIDDEGAPLPPARDGERDP